MTGIIRWAATVLLAALWCASAIAETRVALVIGNSDYEQRGWDLANPVNDVGLVSRALTSVGFEVHALTDLTEDQMERAFQAHGDRLEAAGPDAIGFVFYAGHGVQSEGLNYLIPVDAKLYAEADVWAQSPRLENLFRNLRRAGNRTNFVVLDACRNNELTQSVRSGGGRGLAQEAGATGTFIAYSTQPNNVALDGDRNSPYALALADLIVQPGISAESMFRRVTTRVVMATESRQQPWAESGLLGETDFCFAGCDRTANTPTEAAALVSALNAQSAAALRRFLETYPDTTSRSLVEREIERAENTGPSSGRGAGDAQATGRPPSTMTPEEADELAQLAKDAFAEDNIAEAFTFASAACDGGSAQGCTDLGGLYRLGLGVPQDYARARILFSQGCRGGIAFGCTSLGFLYGQGLGGPQDHERAAALYTQACEAGDAPGCTNLGVLFGDGLGVYEDVDRAFELLQAGCDGGHALGCTNLGILYEAGAGVVSDRARARALYKQGCDGGDENGCAKLASLDDQEQ